MSLYYSLFFVTICNIDQFVSEKRICMNNLNIRAKFTKRSRRIRMCIANSLCKLMEEKPLDKITVTELVKRASVSRMTFYKYYWSKQEVLSDYMFEIVNDYVNEIKGRTDIGDFREFKHIVHCFRFFQQYYSYFHILIQLGMHAIILNAVNDYMEQYVLPNSNYTMYELYYYSGALSNTFMKWVERGMKESPEEIARIVQNSFT